MLGDQILMHNLPMISLARFPEPRMLYLEELATVLWRHRKMPLNKMVHTALKTIK